MTSGYPNPVEQRSFFRDAVAWRTSVTPRVLWLIGLFGVWAVAVMFLHLQWTWDEVSVSHLQYTGGVLVLLLVLRTNASYDRWWEGRKLWGGIVNQSRNLAIGALAYGPCDPAWRRSIVLATAAFPHAARRVLRSERMAPEIAELLGEDVDELARANHLPSLVSARIAARLHEARAAGDLDAMAFHAIERERAVLIDHVGACERILRTPLPLVHKVKLRRFILLYLTALPFVLVSSGALAAVGVTMLVAYPLLAIDQMAQELEQPFAKRSLSHLPLETICAMIQANLEGQLIEDERDAHASPEASSGRK